MELILNYSGNLTKAFKIIAAIGNELTMSNVITRHTKLINEWLDTFSTDSWTHCTIFQLNQKMELREYSFNLWRDQSPSSVISYGETYKLKLLTPVWPTASILLSEEDNETMECFLRHCEWWREKWVRSIILEFSLNEEWLRK